MLNRKLKMGLIGGGPGSFIAAIHLKAAIMDGKTELVAGAFSRDPEKSRQTGRELIIDPSRVYDKYQDMITNEKNLPEGERIDFVSITSLNNTHFSIARDFLQAGFDVMCEKPVTFNLSEARDLRRIVKDSGQIFGVLYNYTGYPMVKLARDIVRDNDLGDIRKIVVRYPQGWLASALEKTGSPQASWRTDPKRCGAAGAIGDIGTHAENLVKYITGLRMTHICAHLNNFGRDRQLDDDGNCLLKFENGASGVLYVSQIAAGEENSLAIWIYGEHKGLEWQQENPNYLYVKEMNGPVQTWRRGNDYISNKSAAAGRATRLPFGHPEAFIEAFANVYCNFMDTIRAKLNNQQADELLLDFPNVDDGYQGMQFIETVIKSATSDQKWTAMVK